MIIVGFTALVFPHTCFRLRPADDFFFVVSTGVRSRDRLLQVLVGSWESTPLALVSGSVATSSADVIHRPEVDKSMSGVAGNVADAAGRRSHSLD